MALNDNDEPRWRAPSLWTGRMGGPTSPPRGSPSTSWPGQMQNGEEEEEEEEEEVDLFRMQMIIYVPYL